MQNMNLLNSQNCSNMQQKNAKYEPAQQSKLLKYAKYAKYEPAQHHLVGHHLLVVLAGKGHIGEVSVIVKCSE